MIKIISQQYNWECGDGCCSESKYKLYFLVEDKDNGSWSQFWVEDCFLHSPNTIEEVFLLYKNDTIIGNLLRHANLCGQVIFKVVDDEYVKY
jgi:hypothetical protein